MRRKTQKMLMAREPLQPSEEQKRKVRTLAFNRVPHDRIARHLGLDISELRWHFAHELELTEDEVLAFAAQNIMALAADLSEPAVALKANQLLLSTRSAAWREPKAESAEQQQRRLADMSTEELEAIIEASTQEVH